MNRQFKLRPEQPNGFFANGVSSQLPPPGTIARSQPIQTVNGPVYPFEDSPVNTGCITGTTNFVATNPLPVTPALLQHGREQFEIYCTPCHGALGDGNGITKKLGVMPAVANLHDKRIVEMADGEIFNTITHGKGLMGAYGPMVSGQGSLGHHRVFAGVAIELARLDQRFAAGPAGRSEITTMNPSNESNQLPPLDLSGWRKLPGLLMVVGAVLVGHWPGEQPGGIRLFLAAGVHVLPDHRAGRLVPGDDPSSDRRRLVGRPSGGSANTSARCCFRGWRFCLCRFCCSRRKFIPG